MRATGRRLRKTLPSLIPGGPVTAAGLAAPLGRAGDCIAFGEEATECRGVAAGATHRCSNAVADARRIETGIRMDVLIALVTFVLMVGVAFSVGSMLTALLNGVRRTLSGRSVADAVMDALHRERVLAHFERMREAALADDMPRLRALEDALLALDVAAWARYRTEKREGARRAGIRLD